MNTYIFKRRTAEQQIITSAEAAETTTESKRRIEENAGYQTILRRICSGVKLGIEGDLLVCKGGEVIAVLGRVTDHESTENDLIDTTVVKADRTIRAAFEFAVLVADNAGVIRVDRRADHLDKTSDDLLQVLS